VKFIVLYQKKNIIVRVKFLVTKLLEKKYILQMTFQIVHLLLVITPTRTIKNLPQSRISWNWGRRHRTPIIIASQLQSRRPKAVGWWRRFALSIWATMVGCSATREDEAMKRFNLCNNGSPSWLITTSPLWGATYGVEFSYEGYKL
jgi:hypothetical protein